MTTHTPAQVLRAYLIADGVVLGSSGSADWRSTYAAMPDAGDNFVTVYDTTPIVLGNDGDTDTEEFHEGLMVEVRSKDYKPGYVKGRAIARSLARIGSNTPVVVEAKNYRLHGFVTSSGLTRVRQDEQGREIFTINGTMAITEL